MEATPRGLLVGGDGMFKGGVRTGRVGFFDFNTVAFPAPAPDTSITTPIEGRVVANNVPFDITGTARVASGTVGRVQVQIQDRDSGQFLQDNGTAFTTFGNSANTSTRRCPVAERPGPGRSRPPSRRTATCWSRPRRSPPPVAARGHHPGDQEVRVVQHRGPDAHDEHHRAERDPVLDHVHHDRHRERRQGVSLSYWFRDSAEPLPAGRRVGGRHLQHVPRDPGRHRRRRRPGRTTSPCRTRGLARHATDTTGQADLRSATGTGSSRRRRSRRASRSRSRWR